MTLIKSMLLGSAAGIVAVASAQAADLPTRKGAPVVQYVQICNVAGITGWTLPGSDTCVKFSGYITSQFTGGNLSTQYNWGTINDFLATPTAAAFPAVSAALAALGPSARAQFTQRVLVQNNDSWSRDETGWTVRANFGFDLASNTEYGPLIGHLDLNAENANGFDPISGATYLNEGYLTWAGITAGKAASFYSFTGGGDNWANFLSPDQKGFNEPDLIAYTASFGGGFSATIAAQSPGRNGGGATQGYSGGGTDIGFPANGNLGGNGGVNPLDITFGGQRWPDFVGALHLKQGWGEAQVSGVLHDVNVRANSAYGVVGSNGTLLADCGIFGVAVCNGSKTETGWGVDAGVKLFLQNWWGGFWGAGDDLIVTGAYSQSAVWYGGMGPGEMMWGEGGQVNGNGQPMYLADAYFNPLNNQWSKPTTWSVTGLLEHHFTPQFYVDLEGSVGQIKWSNMGGGCNILGFGCGIAQFINGPISPSATTWIIGADLGWNPVTNLNFDLELMYQDTNQQRPSGLIGTWEPQVFNPVTLENGVFVPGFWKGTSSGFAGRFRITRYF